MLRSTRPRCDSMMVEDMRRQRPVWTTACPARRLRLLARSRKIPSLMSAVLSGGQSTQAPRARRDVRDKVVRISFLPCFRKRTDRPTGRALKGMPIDLAQCVRAALGASIVQNPAPRGRMHDVPHRLMGARPPQPIVSASERRTFSYLETHRSDLGR